VESAKAGQLQQRGDDQSFEGSFRELVQGINHTLDAVIAPVNAATETLERLAVRDLTSRVEGNYRGDHARIQQSLNSAMDKLSEAMSAVADTAEGVASSAQQIDAGSKELARGASDQAASLEEVSASARELAAMTKRNAASAAEGRSLAEGRARCTRMA
jgi:methyl-accepting chemotaxis protein